MTGHYNVEDVVEKKKGECLLQAISSFSTIFSRVSKYRTQNPGIEQEGLEGISVDAWLERETLSPRSIEDINCVLEYAKLDRSEIKSQTQSIFFADQLHNDEVKLIELDQNLLESLEKGRRIIIRGEKDDSAVLCTETQTYDIKQGEISNQMLLLSDMKFGPDLPKDGEPTATYTQVGSMVTQFFECRPCKPKLQKLKTLLEENPYSGQASEGDEDHQGKKYTLNDILSAVQGSESEIESSLQKLQALVIEGFWRVLDFNFLVQVMTHLIQLCEENDWIQSGIPIEECVSVLQELFPSDVIKHVIKNFASKMETKSTGDDEEEGMQIDIDYYLLDEDKICRFFAEQILKHASKFNLNQFLSTWQKSVPDGMKTSLYQLEGMALIDRESTPETISYLPLDELPEDIAERFNFLFRTKEKWTLEEISPYIRDLQTEKMDVTAMLTKFARASTNNGIKVYNSRKPVY